MSIRDLELERMRDAIASGEPLENPASAEEHASIPSGRKASERPDGSTAKFVGISLIVLGALLGLWAELASASEYSWSTEIDPDKVALKAKLALAGGGFFQIGLIVWLAGYIVHAISFLPGKRK